MFKRLFGKPRSPNFLGIGSPQSGSTWLYQNLNLHPDIQFPKKKELQFFTQCGDLDIDIYEENFARLDSRFVGEYSPNYCLLGSKKIEFVHYYVPKVRLIFIARNPIDRAWASARRTMAMLAQKRGVAIEAIPEEEYIEYLSAEHKYRFNELLNRPFIDAPRQRRSSFYAENITAWLQVFDESQLLILNFDDIISNPLFVLKSSIEHIGASFMPGLNFNVEKINKNVEVPDSPKIKSFLRSTYASEIIKLKSMYPSIFNSWDCEAL